MVVCGKSQENAHLTMSTLTQVWLMKCESKLAKEILVRVFMLLKKKKGKHKHFFATWNIVIDSFMDQTTG